MNNNLKKAFLSIVFLVTAGIFTQAETVRMGVTGAIDFMERPNYQTIIQNYVQHDALWKGIYWEVLFDNFGFGGTYLSRFDHQTAGSYLANYDWTISWLGSFDFRYHLLKDFFIDPFAEFGFGCAGSVLLPYHCEPDMQSLNLSLFGDVGLGAALKLNNMHIGGKLNYYFTNQPIPVTQFTVYPLENFSFALFAGLNF